MSQSNYTVNFILCGPAWETDVWSELVKKKKQHQKTPTKKTHKKP